MSGRGKNSGDDIFTAERIKAKRVNNGRIEYHIKWKGYPNNESTWEPEEHVIDRGLLAAFERSEARRKGRRIPTSTPSKSKNHIPSRTSQDPVDNREVSIDHDQPAATTSRVNHSSTSTATSPASSPRLHIASTPPIISDSPPVTKALRISTPTPPPQPQQITHYSPSPTRPSNSSSSPRLNIINTSNKNVSSPHKVSKDEIQPDEPVLHDSSTSCVDDGVVQLINYNDTNHSPIKMSPMRMSTPLSVNNNGSSHNNYSINNNSVNNNIVNNNSVNSNIVNSNSVNSNSVSNSNNVHPFTVSATTHLGNNNLTNNNISSLKNRCFSSRFAILNTVITDVTVNDQTITISESKTNQGFFKEVSRSSVAVDVTEAKLDK